MMVRKVKVLLSNSEDIRMQEQDGEQEERGENVFICDSKSGHVIRTNIRWDDKCQDCNKSHLGVIELPSHWIGKKVFIRPFEIVRG